MFKWNQTDPYLVAHQCHTLNIADPHGVSPAILVLNKNMLEWSQMTFRKSPVSSCACLCVCVGVRVCPDDNMQQVPANGLSGWSFCLDLLHAVLRSKYPQYHSFPCVFSSLRQPASYSYRSLNSRPLTLVSGYVRVETRADMTPTQRLNSI